MSILFDGHIHIHPAVDLNCLLDAAWVNFSAAKKHVFPDSDKPSFVLLLAEGKENDVFSKMVNGQADTSSQDSWHFTPTKEENSVLAIRGANTIIIIAGRQLISSENLELLSLFCKKKFPDKTHTVTDLAKLVTDEGGVPLLAWGVGKWFGKRGMTIRQFINNPAVPHYFVGDNGNRPTFWGYPKLLRLAEEKNIPSLPGSDPLPIRHHELRAGSYGAGIAEASLGKETPAAELRQLLIAGTKTISFGKGAGIISFIRDQLQANLQKRLP